VKHFIDDYEFEEAAKQIVMLKEIEGWGSENED